MELFSKPHSKSTKLKNQSTPVKQSEDKESGSKKRGPNWEQWENHSHSERTTTKQKPSANQASTKHKKKRDTFSRNMLL